MMAAPAFAQNGLQQPNLVAPAAGYSSYNRAMAEASPSDSASQFTPAAYSDSSNGCACEEPACGCEEPACGCESSCCCEPSCGCDSCGCGGSWLDGGCLGDCCLGDPCTLQDHIAPCCDHKFGGWVALGYYNDNNRLSTAFADGKAFLDVPDHLNLDQAWVWFEKLASAGACSADWGYRFDMLYGGDAQKTQAFGNDDGIWDVTFDHGYYGWAMPQAYGEVAYGDLSVKIGHFFTIIGYEVVQATGNFFYSHSYTMFNSEPFTHTGVLGTYTGLGDDVTLYGGWTAGWDTGFDQANGGSIFLGGISMPLGDSITATYALTAGNFGLRSAGGSGYSHSIVAIADVTDNTQYVFQSDYAGSDGFGDDPTFDARDYGINQYLFYTLNDCWKLGGRMEWWKSNTVTGNQASFYELTGGINYFPHANVVVRPEIRYNWAPGDVAAADAAGINDWNNTVFAIDAVVTF
jgi:hypothetical protein